MSVEGADATRLELASQCRRVTLTPHAERLAAAAVELHLVGNDGSDERWATDQDYRERAEMGYRAELAAAEHYGLQPTIDYRPPTVGDAGHDYRLELDGEVLTVDVKATRTSPPTLYLTRKRAWHDRYTLPDAYLLAAPNLTPDDSIHLVGWVRTERLRDQGRETEQYGNPVWTMNGLELAAPPSPTRVEPLPTPEREVFAATDRADIDADRSAVREALTALGGDDAE